MYSTSTEETTVLLGYIFLKQRSFILAVFGMIIFELDPVGWLFAGPKIATFGVSWFFLLFF